MKLTAALALCVLVTVVASNRLLGADDTDERQSKLQAGAAEPAESALPMRDLKSGIKQEKADLKTLKQQMTEMKTRLKSGSLSKKEKKQLRIEHNALKMQLNAKKHQWTADKETLKIRKQQRAAAPKKGHKKGRRGKKGGASKSGLPLVAEDDLVENEMSKKELKQLLKTGRRSNRGGKSKKGGEVQADQPITFLKPKKMGRKVHNRTPCSTDTDCTHGAKCRTTKHGSKFCRGGTDKPIGGKCFTSEHCARGLKCFVKTDAPIAKKHNKKRGVCADPKTADLTVGALLPFRQHHRKTKTH